MNPLPKNIYSAADAAQIDLKATRELGLPGTLLMERAGASAFKWIRRYFQGKRRWVVLCGSGNNGGDGYVVARLAQAAGMEVTVCATNAPRPKTEAARAQAAFRDSGGRVVTFDPGIVRSGDLIVDGLLGTGLSRAVEGIFAEMIKVANQGDVPICALDIPSGVAADTGAILGQAIRAKLTITFVTLKLGLLTGDGPDRVGRLVYDDLGVGSAASREIEPMAFRITRTWAARRLPPRKRTAHKGLFGHVFVVGGNHGMGGAALLAGESAQRVGSGLVSVLTRPEHVLGMLSGRPELMVHGVDEGHALPDAAENATVFAVGPGLGRGNWARNLLRLCLTADKPSVVDADALNLIAEAPDLIDFQKRTSRRIVLTPHPGEAARLLRTNSVDIQKDRPGAACELARRYRATVVLKGAGTLIATEGVPLSVCDSGNPGMASGGMGDVLTGVIAGLLAQGLETHDAACLGVWLHATAGDEAARDEGERGLLASDLIGNLRRISNPVWP